MLYHDNSRRSAPDDDHAQDKMALTMMLARAREELAAHKRAAKALPSHEGFQAKIARAEAKVEDLSARLKALA